MSQDGAVSLSHQAAVGGAAGEEGSNRGFEGLGDLAQRGHRGRRPVVLDLGVEALGQASRLGELLERLTTLFACPSDRGPERLDHAGAASVADRAAASSNPASPSPRPWRRTMADAAKMHVRVTTSINVAITVTK